ncbi:mRNA decay activator protein ZFP36L2-B-like [Chanos chanos]|uniref:mRNA decay activator protein ZFP36 n=1 Tax=Chanos chanos TaxID=29144 RepID=A0A6J2UVX5_CHACN|nr:mRNA decay activator protein ZFP36L2-B-like [Chanos chanos]
MSDSDLLLSPFEEAVEDQPFSDKGVGLSLAEVLLPLVKSPSPAPTPKPRSTRYKTVLCRLYAETGTCKYAERCQFAHGFHDLRMPSQHPKYKTELCHAFYTTSYCVYGSRCLFAHSLVEQRPVRHQRRNVPCRTFRSFGVCPFGTRCRFLHVEGSGLESDGAEEDVWAAPFSQNWKNRDALCHTFSSLGFCHYGTRCRFQHRVSSTKQDSDYNLESPWSSKIPGKAVFDVQSLSLSSSLSTSPTSALASPVCPEDSQSSSPPSSEPMANNAFTFTSQDLNDLLLPLALRLQQLENVGHAQL